MSLVDDQAAVGRQQKVALELPQEDAVRHELDGRAGLALHIVAHLHACKRSQLSLTDPASCMQGLPLCEWYLSCLAKWPTAKVGGELKHHLVSRLLRLVAVPTKQDPATR